VLYAQGYRNHEEAPLYIEAYRAAAWFIDEHVTCDVSDDVEATITTSTLKALYNVVAEHRGRRTPGLEYAAEVVIIDWHLGILPVTQMVNLRTTGPVGRYLPHPRESLWPE